MPLNTYIIKQCFFSVLLLFVCSRLLAQEKHVVYFNLNSFHPKTDEINALRIWIREHHSPGSITINGYTDTVGSRNYNKILSARRAEVVAALIQSSYRNYSVQIQFFGEDSLASITNQRQNRRVEIIWDEPHSLIDKPKADTPRLILDTFPANGKLLDIPALESIYFIPDKAVIESSSLPFVEELASILRNYPARAVFEIRGHVNAPGKKFDKLSEDRAKEVYLQLIDMGVPAVNLRYKGMGIKQRVFPNPQNEAEMRKNIRVDIVVYQ